MKSRAPTRKVTSYTAGGALGGHIAVLLAYQFPHVPTMVIGSYTALLVILIGFVAGYLVPPEGD